MPITALAVGSFRIHESTFDPDKGKPEATKWHVHTLDSRVMGHVRDRATTMKIDPSRPDDEVETTINAEAVAFELFQFGVTFENFVGPDGNEIECKMVNRRLAGKSYKILDPEVVGMVPGRVIKEMAELVRRENDLDLEDLGNLGGQSTQSNSSPNTTA